MFVGYRNQIPRWRMLGLGMNPLGEFAPTDIAGLLLWLTAEEEFLFTDAAATIPVTADGDLVGAWQDRSGNNNDFTQATGAKKPEFKTAQIGGKDVVRLDGIDNLLTALNFSSALQGSLFITYELNTGIQDNKQIFSSADEASNSRRVGFRGVRGIANNFVSVEQNNNDGAQEVEGSTALVIDTTYLAVWRSNGSAYTFRVNGVDEVPNIVAGANNGDWFGDTGARDNFVVGALKFLAGETQFFRGDKRQALLYDTNLTGDDLANVEAFLAADAGVVLP